MKKMNSKLFEKNNEISKREMTSLLGGANSSDVNYNDTKKDNGGGWDIGVKTLIDVVDTSTGLDKPHSGTLIS
jgi:natural product precursor